MSVLVPFVSFLSVSLTLLLLVQDSVSGFAPLRNSFRSLNVLKQASSNNDEPNLRIGHGFDIHRLIEGTKLIIGA
jgi:UPF0716 family protein affecting phage T7 exclusion